MVAYHRCDSTLLNCVICTLQGWFANFNDIHGRIKPIDFLIMCSAHMQQAFVLASTLVRVHCNETNARTFEAI